jgi:predicted transcriptional regulator
MNQTDDRILELLDESDLVLSPSVIAVNLDYTRNWVSRRISRLVEAGLIEARNGSYYAISELGKAYLNGEVSADKLEG